MSCYRSSGAGEEDDGRGFGDTRWLRSGQKEFVDAYGDEIGFWEYPPVGFGAT